MISFTEADAAPLPGHLRARELTALEWWAKRPKSEHWQLDTFPTFTEALIAYLATRTAELPPGLEALCHYAEDVRQGRWVDRVPPEQAPQALYLAIAQATLPDQTRFLDELTAFFDVIARRATEPVTSTGFFAAEPRFQKYVAALADDQRLYGEDQQRAQTWRLMIGQRSVKLLALDKPVSTQFKLWARKNDDCALLLVKQPDGTLVLSADPSSKLKVDWAAPILSKLDAHPWYGGERHEGTLIASSREGTRLSFDHIRRALGARVPTAKAMLAIPLLVALAAATLALMRPHGHSSAKGAPLDKAQVVNLLQQPGGPASFEAFAIIVGVCGYTGEHALTAPCNDARAVRDALVGHFGYHNTNVLLLVDDEPDSPQPDAATLKLSVERFRALFPRASAHSSLLFYYSGHGGYEKGARKDFGLLQPAGYFEHPEQPMGVRGWDMQELIDDLRKGVPSRHVMVVLDACYSGWATGSKGAAVLSSELRLLWAERAEVVLTAGTKGQRAWENDKGRSFFTAGLLDGLAFGDVNSDGVITDEELATYLEREVPAKVRELKRAEQSPQFFRFDEALPKSGQFLFVRSP